MDKLHCFFIQLSTNNYMDHDTIPSVTDHHRHNYLTTEKHVWDEITQFAADNGCNSILIDLADGVKYKSHPEIVVTLLKEEKQACASALSAIFPLPLPAIVKVVPFI